jgi:hypothetical protein
MNILEMLKGGDLRSIGKANQVAQLVCSEPKLVKSLIEGIYSDDPVLRARSADALEKVSSQFPGYVQPFKNDVLNKISKMDQQEVKWHVALILPRLRMSAAEKVKAERLLSKWLETEKGNIVRVNSLQALFELSKDGSNSIIKKKLHTLIVTGTPSLRARCRKLLQELK